MLPILPLKSRKKQKAGNPRVAEDLQVIHVIIRGASSPAQCDRGERKNSCVCYPMNNDFRGTTMICLCPSLRIISIGWVTTGLFIASGTFGTPLISVVYGPILKPFEVVIVIRVRFDLVYNNA